MSVDLEELLHRDGKPTTGNYPNLPRAVALVGHKLEAYLDRKLEVEHQPLDENYYHGGVKGTKDKKIRRWLAANYEIVVDIDTAVAQQHAIADQGIG